MIRKAIVAVVVVAVVGVGVFYYFKKTTVVSTTTGGLFGAQTSTTTNKTDVLPEVATGTQPAFIPGSGQAIPRLYELHNTPVAGVTFVEMGSGKKYVVSARYIERAVGNIFDTDLSTYVESRIVNETRSRLSEALWGQNGKSVVIRSLVGSVIKTSILNLSNPTKALAPDGTKNFMTVAEISLPDSIPFMATAEDGTNKLFYLQNGTSAVGSITTFKNTSTSKSFTSLFKEWIPQFPNQNLVTLTTKASVNTPGFLFFLNTKTKALNKILGDINGLTTLTNQDGSMILYSETKDGLPKLSVYDIQNKEKRDLSIQTLAEKCVWGKKETSVVYCAVPRTIPEAFYPDQWYQGSVQFSDSLWKIDTKTTIAQEIATSQDFKFFKLDITNMGISSNDVYLLFINKTTDTPWVFRITE